MQGVMNSIMEYPQDMYSMVTVYEGHNYRQKCCKQIFTRTRDACDIRTRQLKCGLFVKELNCKMLIQTRRMVHEHIYLNIVGKA